MKPRIVALVPIRHNSERVPGKNYRLFGGKELYHHIIESLLDCELIDEVVINTDSTRIMEDAYWSSADLKIIFGSAIVPDIPPELICSFFKIRLARFNRITQNCSFGKSIKSGFINS